jgi:hypothetical protein
MIHIVEEIKLLLLLGNRLVILVRRKHIRGNYKKCMYACVFQNNSGTPRTISAKLGTHIILYFSILLHCVVQ